MREKFISNKPKTNKRIIGVNHTMTFKIQRDISHDLEKYFQELKRLERRHGKNITLSGCANNVIRDALILKKLIANIAPAYTVIGDVDKKGRLHISDDETGEIYPIMREGNKLRCVKDDVTNCVHVLVATHSPKAIGFFNTEDMEEMPTIRLGSGHHSKSPSMIEGDGET